MSGNLKNRIEERLYADYSVAPPFPVKHMNVEISNYCNHNCIFCARNKKEKTFGLMDEVFYSHIMQEAFYEGVREVGLFINGEPFTHPKLSVYIRLAKEIGYHYVYLTTNGSLATPENLRKSVDAGLDSIKFSINAATNESYAKVHGRDDFEKVIDNLNYAREFRNISGKKYKIFGSFFVTNITEMEAEYFKQHYGYLFDDLAFYKIRGYGMMQENAKLTTNFTARLKCTLPFNTIAIDYDGSLLVCCQDINQRVFIADLSKVSLRQAWYGENMTNFRKMHIDDNLAGTICEECLESGGGVAEVLDI